MANTSQRISDQDFYAEIEQAMQGQMGQLNTPQGQTPDLAQRIKEQITKRGTIAKR